MTEEKPKRRHWRRGSRRRKEEGAGAPGAPPAGVAPDAAEGAVPPPEAREEAGAEAAGRGRGAEKPERAPAEAPPAAPEGAAEAAGEEGEKKPRRKRARRSSKKEPAVAEASEATPPTVEEAQAARDLRAEKAPADRAPGEEGAAPAPEGAAEPAKKERRRRPRRAAKPKAGAGVPEEGAAAPEGAAEAAGEAPSAEAPPAEATEAAPPSTSVFFAARPKREGLTRLPADLSSTARGTEGAGPVAEAPPPPGADVPETGEEIPGEPLQTPPEGQAAAEGAEGVRTGRRRRRRNRRRGRRGKGQGQEGQPQAGAEAGTEEEAEEGIGAEGTESEEPAAAVRETEDEEAEADYAEEGLGDGARRVMLIDGIHPEEIRVAVVADNVLDYFEVENQRRKQFKGNIYKGKVVNIAPAIEAAFVEFGGGRHGFLPLNEYCGGALVDKLDHWDENEKRPPLRPGMEILVQVTKEESTVKGAALTSYISIAGRYLVMMLGMKRYGISKKITGEKERERIRKQMEKLEYPEHLGFIVRTVGAARPLKDLKADLQNLVRLWDRTLEGARTLKAPALLYEEQDIVIRTLRDSYSADVAEVLMNSEDSYRKAVEFFDIYYPKQKNRLKLIRQKRPLYSKFNLEEQVERMTARRVGLPSGGHIVLDRTEAMWCIDVNSGRSSKDRDIEDTAYRTNREAAIEAMRQLRIRDMGGLIVIDFIDMENRNHIKEIERTLKECLRKDKAKSDVSNMGKFGLVAISRQRMGISFHDVMLKGCDQCNNTGFVSTPDAVAVRLLRRVHDELSRDGAKELVFRVSPSLLETLLNQKREEISRLEKICGTKVQFTVDASLAPGGFAVGPAAT